MEMPNHQLTLRNYTKRAKIAITNFRILICIYAILALSTYIEIDFIQRIKLGYYASDSEILFNCFWFGNQKKVNQIFYHLTISVE